jgi:hypothetical protein
MIPYDDLVVALQTWRARQGLPVAQLSGVMVPPPAVAAPVPVPRTNPPAPPKAVVPPPLAPVETRDDEVEEASLIEEAHYENEGDDFAMAFNAAVNEGAEEPDESTAIGTPPPPVAAPRDSFGGSTEPEPVPGKHNDDW